MISSPVEKGLDAGMMGLNGVKLDILSFSYLLIMSVSLTWNELVLVVLSQQSPWQTIHYGVARLARLGRRRLRRRRQPPRSELDRMVRPGVVRPHPRPPRHRQCRCPHYLPCRQNDR